METEINKDSQQGNAGFMETILKASQDQTLPTTEELAEALTAYAHYRQMRPENEATERQTDMQGAWLAVKVLMQPFVASMEQLGYQKDADLNREVQYHLERMNAIRDLKRGYGEKISLYARTVKKIVDLVVFPHDLIDLDEIPEGSEAIKAKAIEDLHNELSKEHAYEIREQATTKALERFRVEERMLIYMKSWSHHDEEDIASCFTKNPLYGNLNYDEAVEAALHLKHFKVHKDYNRVIEDLSGLIRRSSPRKIQ